MAYQDTLPLENSLLNMENSLLNMEELQLPRRSVSEHRSITPQSQESTDSCHNNEAYEKGQIDVIVKRVEKASIVDDCGMPSYNMSAYPRGLALIIEIEEYVNKVQDKRIGSHVDVENLSKLFEQLHFDLTHKKNLTRQEFYKELRSFAQNSAHRDADMMILAVLSHGRDGQVYASDGLVVETEDIYARFNNQNCPLLRGKPKFFIVQACRGEDTDVAFELYPEEKVATRKRRIGTDFDTVPMYPQGELNTARPTWEDMIIAYSTIPGFTSQRDHEKGTWFIQALVETFMNHAHDRELIDLLRMTSDYLSKFTNDHGEKQTCNVEMRHLYKRIYFLPGLKGIDRRRISDVRMSPQTLKRSLSFHSTTYGTSTL